MYLLGCWVHKKVYCYPPLSVQWKPHQVSPCHPGGMQSMPPDVPLAVDAALLLPVCDFKSWPWCTLAIS
jgi:hypothetical protein